ncbi:hypothetical protein LRS10_21780 [Phenylobacterium sp. J426]|uniref:hypothetical protein n=1 Tax=Phenylobacterium sp. J426 TaxID=2898439 RepID=UPI0021508872|nr:hypothetical protein [Phenylobacterium sp. J426]MCR5876542.1 hypothetical protein [Phenylobacterium sp. J426]
MMLNGELVPTPDQAMPFKVVVRRGEAVLRERPVESLDEGHRQLERLITALREP